jgi:membrane-associated protein
VAATSTRTAYPGRKYVPRSVLACQHGCDDGGASRCALWCAAVLASLLALNLNPSDLIKSLSPYGEIGVMFIIFAETGLLVGFFLPGDSLLFTAGLLAGTGDLDVALVVVCAFAGAFIGSEVGYLIGKQVGPRLFTKQESRFFKQEYVERTHAFFERHGPKTIVLARFVPIVRTFTPVMAGVGNMQRRVYTLYNLIGALLWAVGLSLLGWGLGDTLFSGKDKNKNIDKYLLPLVAVVILVSLIPVLLEWRKSRRNPVGPATPEAAVAEAEEIHDLVDPD